MTSPFTPRSFSGSFEMKASLFLVLGLHVLLASTACSSNSRANTAPRAGAGAENGAEAGAVALERSSGYERGEIVIIAGVASDLDNQPVAELEVVLEASRHSFDYLRFRKHRPVVRKTTTTTAADGAFEIQWPWDKGFNRFALVFGITVKEPGGERFHVLHREDLSRRIEHGSPVVSYVQIADTSFLDSFLEFRAGLESETQREVYREAGKPDKVRARDSADGTDVDWWYFELGKVYRFRNGELQEVENFEPVTSFDS